MRLEGVTRKLKADAMQRINAGKRSAELPAAFRRTLRRVFFLAVVLYALTIFIGQGFRVISLRSEVARIKEEIEFHRVNTEIMQRRVEAMQGDEYVEQVAREQLGLVMPGEVAYIRVNDYSLTSE